jgi:phage terminase large subunit-like protein
MELDVKLLSWQQKVWNDPTRFKVVVAGRRTGKSRLAAWLLIVNALQTEKGHVWYIANTQSQARDVMWSTLLDLGHPVVESSHINNLQIKLINGTTISLKGADRPETMRGVSLKFVVMDEYGSMKSMSSFAFRQEFMASFEAASGGLFREDWIQYDEEEPERGRWYIACDIAGFSDVAHANTARKKRLDQTAIAIVKVDEDRWWVRSIEHGRWDIKKTASKIFQAVTDFQPLCVGIEKGIGKNAVMGYLSDMMRQYNTYFRVEDVTHGNKKKIDRITWSLQGRFEHGKITLNKGSWNSEFLDQLLQFPNPQVHDDLIDALSYIEQVQIPEYNVYYEEEEYEPLDTVTGY